MWHTQEYYFQTNENGPKAKGIKGGPKERKPQSDRWTYKPPPTTGAVRDRGHPP